MGHHSLDCHFVSALVPARSNRSGFCAEAFDLRTAASRGPAGCSCRRMGGPHHCCYAQRCRLADQSWSHAAGVLSRRR